MRSVILLLLLSICSLETAAFQAKTEITFVEKQGNLSQYRLENGLKVLLLPDSSTPVVSLMVLYHVGSRNEAVGYTGATHLLEHMLFKGTPAFNKERGTQIAAILESLGADYNATTWFDRTNYYETLPSDRLEVALQIEADRMRNSLILDSDRQSEMTVVRNELELLENDPAAVLDVQTYAMAYREHPYHHPTIGWRSDVEGVPTERLKQFYDTFYWPNNATLVVVGDFEEKQLLEQVEKYFASIPSSPKPIPQVYTVEPKQQGERRFVLRRAGELRYLQMVWHTVDARNPEIYPLILLEAILSQGMTSRLQQLLVEQQLAVAVEAQATRLYDPGTFEITATIASGVETLTVERVIRAEIERLRKEKVSPEELNRAKVQILAEHAYANDGPAAITAELSEAISNGDWKIYIDFEKNIEKVSAEQIQSVVQKYLLDDNLTVGHFEPIKEPLAQADRRFSKPTVTNSVQPHAWRRRGESRVEGKVKELPPSAAKSSTPFASRIKRSVLRNGAVVLAFERRTSPTVVISGTLNAGSYFEPRTKPHLAEITAAMLSAGSRRYSRLQLAQELESLGAQLEFDTDNFVLSFEGKCLRRDLKRLLSLLAEQLLFPTFPEEELEKLKKQAIAELMQDKEDTYLRAYERLTQMAFRPDSPYYRHTPERLISSVEAISIKDVESFYHKYYSGASMVVSIVGDIDANIATEEVRRLFEGWRSGIRQKIDVAPTPLPNASDKQYVQMSDKANVDIFIGHPGGVRRSSPDYHAAILANHALGQSTLSSRLGLQVRDTEGLTYGIISRFFEVGLGDGLWAISVSVSPENVHRAIDSSMKVLRNYTRDGITDKELAESKSSIIGAFKVGLSSNSGIADMLLEMELHSLGLDYIDRYPEYINSVSKEDVNRAIRRYFHPDKVLIAIAGEVSGQK